MLKQNQITRNQEHIKTKSSAKNEPMDRREQRAASKDLPGGSPLATPTERLARLSLRRRGDAGRYTSCCFFLRRRRSTRSSRGYGGSSIVVAGSSPMHERTGWRGKATAGKAKASPTHPPSFWFLFSLAVIIYPSIIIIKAIFPY
jgi:hypothetical protein